MKCGAVGPACISGQSATRAACPHAAASGWSRPTPFDAQRTVVLPSVPCRLGSEWPGSGRCNPPVPPWGQKSNNVQGQAGGLGSHGIWGLGLPCEWSQVLGSASWGTRRDPGGWALLPLPPSCSPDPVDEAGGRLACPPLSPVPYQGFQLASPPAGPQPGPAPLEHVAWDRPLLSAWGRRGTIPGCYTSRTETVLGPVDWGGGGRLWYVLSGGPPRREAPRPPHPLLPPGPHILQP